LLIIDDLTLPLIVSNNLIEFFESKFNHGQLLLRLFSQRTLLEEFLLCLQPKSGLTLNYGFSLVKGVLEVRIFGDNIIRRAVGRVRGMVECSKKRLVLGISLKLVILKNGLIQKLPKALAFIKVGPHFGLKLKGLCKLDVFSKLLYNRSLLIKLSSHFSVLSFKCTY
jgi:hypothetical protein